MKKYTAEELRAMTAEQRIKAIRAQEQEKAEREKAFMDAMHKASIKKPVQAEEQEAEDEEQNAEQDEATAEELQEQDENKIVQSAVYKVLSNNYNNTGTNFYRELMNSYGQDKQAELYLERVSQCVELEDKIEALEEVVDGLKKEKSEQKKILRKTTSEATAKSTGKYLAFIDTAIKEAETAIKKHKENIKALTIKSESYSDRKDLEQAGHTAYINFILYTELTEYWHRAPRPTNEQTAKEHNCKYASEEDYKYIHGEIKREVKKAKEHNKEERTKDEAEQNIITLDNIVSKVRYRYICRAIRTTMQALASPDALTAVHTKWTKCDNNGTEAEQKAYSDFKHFCESRNLKDNAEMLYSKEYVSSRTSKLYNTYDIIVSGHRLSNGKQTNRKDGIYKIQHWYTTTAYTYFSAFAVDENGNEADFDKKINKYVTESIDKTNNPFIFADVDLEQLHKMIIKCNLSHDEQLFMHNLINSCKYSNCNDVKALISHAWDIVAQLTETTIDSNARAKRMQRLRDKIKKAYPSSKRFIAEAKRAERAEIEREIERKRATRKPWFELDGNYFVFNRYHKDTKQCVNWISKAEREEERRAIAERYKAEYSKDINGNVRDVVYSSEPQAQEQPKPTIATVRNIITEYYKTADNKNAERTIIDIVLDMSIDSTVFTSVPSTHSKYTHYNGKTKHRHSYIVLAIK